MQVWVVLGECGDYYCNSCGTGHLVAICHSKERADVDAANAPKTTTTYLRADGTTNVYSTINDAWVEGPFEIDTPILANTTIDQRRRDGR